MPGSLASRVRRDCVLGEEEPLPGCPVNGGNTSSLVQRKCWGPAFLASWWASPGAGRCSGPGVGVPPAGASCAGKVGRSVGVVESVSKYQPLSRCGRCRGQVTAAPGRRGPDRHLSPEARGGQCAQCGTHSFPRKLKVVPKAGLGAWHSRGAGDDGVQV